MTCDQASERAFKRGAFSGGHIAKEFGVILVGDRSEDRDERPARSCQRQSVCTQIARAVLTRDQPLLYEPVRQFADGSAGESKALRQATGATALSPCSSCITTHSAGVTSLSANLRAKP